MEGGREGMECDVGWDGVVRVWKRRGERERF